MGFFLLIALLLVPTGQPIHAIAETEIPDPGMVSIDQTGHVYLADNSGNIYKYDASGKQAAVFSPPQTAKIQLLEAWSGLRIFCFQRDVQEYFFLNRFLTATGSYGFDPDKVGFAEMATPSFDNNLWVIDQADFSLKKYDITRNDIIMQTSLDLLLDRRTYRLGFMKEYQNKLYISDKTSGILVFDNLGNYLKKIEAQGIEYFNFYGDEIYFTQNHQLVFINLYNDTRRSIGLPEKAKIKFGLVGQNDQYYLFEGGKLLVCQ